MTKAPFVSETLAEHHATAEFACGKPALDTWLKASALHSQANRTARTFVWHQGDGKVVAYFSLAAFLVRRSEVPKRVGRGSPETIPAVILARLALATSLQGRGLGEELLFDACSRAVAATEHVGARLLVVDALDEPAARFYERYGFERMPGALRLVQKISDVRAALEG